MAIKGKKKSQRRGSQGARRPAPAPRPTGPYQRPVPWYKTSGGRVGVAIFIVLLLGSIGGIIAAVTREDPIDVAAQNSLQDYTVGLGNVLQATSEAGAGIAAAPSAPQGKAFDALADDAAGWAASFEASQLTASQLSTPLGLEGSAQLIQESLALYAAAAKTYALAPEAKGRLQLNLLERAAEQRDLATAVWRNALIALDEARAEVDLAPSSLQSPAEQPAMEVPDADETPAAEDGGEDDAG